MKKKYLRYVTIILVTCLYSCKLVSPSVTNYDSYSYVQTTSLKVDALSLMDVATEDYSSHQKDIQTVQNNIQKIYEYEKHRPKNDFTIKQWQILTDSTGHLWGGFIVKWRTENKVNKVYLDEKKKQIGTAFDQIAELESKKIKPADIKN